MSVQENSSSTPAAVEINGHFPLPKSRPWVRGATTFFKRAPKYFCAFFLFLFLGPTPISTLIHKGTLRSEVHSSPLDSACVSVLPEHSDFPLPMVIKTEVKRLLLPPRKFFFFLAVFHLHYVKYREGFFFFNSKQNWIIHQKRATRSLFLAFAICSQCLDSLQESQIKLAIHHWLPCSYASIGEKAASIQTHETISHTSISCKVTSSIFFKPIQVLDVAIYDLHSLISSMKGKSFGELCHIFRGTSRMIKCWCLI